MSRPIDPDSDHVHASTDADAILRLGDDIYHRYGVDPGVTSSTSGFGRGESLAQFAVDRLTLLPAIHRRWTVESRASRAGTQLGEIWKNIQPFPRRSLSRGPVAAIQRTAISSISHATEPGTNRTFEDQFTLSQTALPPEGLHSPDPSQSRHEDRQPTSQVLPETSPQGKTLTEALSYPLNLREAVTVKPPVNFRETHHAVLSRRELIGSPDSSASITLPVSQISIPSEATSVREISFHEETKTDPVSPLEYVQVNENSPQAEQHLHRSAISNTHALTGEAQRSKAGSVYLNKAALQSCDGVIPTREPLSSSFLLPANLLQPVEPISYAAPGSLEKIHTPGQSADLGKEHTSSTEQQLRVPGELIHKARTQPAQQPETAAHQSPPQIPQKPTWSTIEPHSRALPELPAALIQPSFTSIVQRPILSRAARVSLALRRDQPAPAPSRQEARQESTIANPPARDSVATRQAPTNLLHAAASSPIHEQRHPGETINLQVDALPAAHISTVSTLPAAQIFSVPAPSPQSERAISLPSHPFPSSNKQLAQDQPKTEQALSRPHIPGVPVSGMHVSPLLSTQGSVHRQQQPVAGRQASSQQQKTINSVSEPPSGRPSPSSQTGTPALNLTHDTSQPNQPPHSTHEGQTSADAVHTQIPHVFTALPRHTSVSSSQLPGIQRQSTMPLTIQTTDLNTGSDIQKASVLALPSTPGSASPLVAPQTYRESNGMLDAPHQSPSAENPQRLTHATSQDAQTPVATHPPELQTSYPAHNTSSAPTRQGTPTPILFSTLADPPTHQQLRRTSGRADTSIHAPHTPESSNPVRPNSFISHAAAQPSPSLVHTSTAPIHRRPAPSSAATNTANDQARVLNQIIGSPASADTQHYFTSPGLIPAPPRQPETSSVFSLARPGAVQRTLSIPTPQSPSPQPPVPPTNAQPAVNMAQLANQVYELLARRLATERRRKGA